MHLFPVAKNVALEPGWAASARGRGYRASFVALAASSSASVRKLGIGGRVAVANRTPGRLPPLVIPAGQVIPTDQTDMHPTAHMSPTDQSGGPITAPPPTAPDRLLRMIYFRAMLGVLAGRVTAAAAVAAATVAAVAAIAAAGAAPASAATAPTQGTLHLYVPDAFLVGGHLVTVPGRTVHIQGVVSPYVAGQTVLVKAFVGGKQFKTDRLRIKPSPGGRTGRFTEVVSSPSAGQVTVQVGHTRTDTLGGLLARRRFAALDEHAGFGSRGSFVALIQQRLAALHFYIPQTGVYDGGTGLALDAYHRLLHWGTYQTLDGRTISYLLDGFGAFKVRFPSHGRHAEGNLSLQLLALVERLARAGDLSDQLGQAVDPDRPGRLPRLLEGSRIPARRDVLLELLHQRVRHPRLQPGARLSRQPRLHARPDPGRDLDLQLAADRQLGRRLLLVRPS